MTYMKKNVSLLLLLLIVVILSSLAGLTSYYQLTYKNLTAAYQQKVYEASALSGNLSQHKSVLNQTYQELETKRADLSKFDVLYTNLTKINDQLRSTLAQTQAELDQTLNELYSVRDQLAAVQSQLQAAQATIASQSAQISSLQSQVNSLNSQISQKNAEICSLKQQLGQTC